MPRTFRPRLPHCTTLAHRRLATLILALGLNQPSAGPAQPSPDPDVKTRIARATCEQALAAQRWADALPACQAVLTAAEQRLGPLDETVMYGVATVGEILVNLGDLAAAERLFQRCLNICEKARGAEHPDTARALHNLGVVYMHQGRPANAQPLLERSLRISEKAHAHFEDLAEILNSLGAVYLAQGLDSQAERLLVRSLRLGEIARGPAHPETVRARTNLATLYNRQKRYAEAEPLLLRSLRHYEAVQDTKSVAKLLNQLGGLYLQQGRYADAEASVQRSREVCEKAPVSEKQDLVTSLKLLGVTYLQQGRGTDAEASLQRSVQICEMSPQCERSSAAESLHILGLLYAAQGRTADAVAMFQRSLDFFDTGYGPKPADLARVRISLAELYIAENDFNQTLPHLCEILERSFPRLGLFDYTSLQAIELLMQVRHQLGHDRELDDLFSRFYAAAMQGPRPGQVITTEAKLKFVQLMERGFWRAWLTRKFAVAEQIATLAYQLPLAKNADMANALERIWAQLVGTSPAERKLLSARAAFAKGRDEAHAMGLFDRGLDAAAQGRMSEALRFLRDGLYLGEGHLRRQKSVKAVAEWLGRERPFLHLIFELARSQPQDAATLRLAWTATLLTKGRTLDAETRALRVLHDPKVALQNPMLWRMQQDVKNRVRQGAVAGAGGSELQALGQQAREMESSLSQSMEAARIEVLPEPFEMVHAVASKLPKDGVLVDFVEYTPPQLGSKEEAARYLALLLFRAEAGSEPRMQALDLGEVQTHGPRMAELVKALRDPSSQPEKAARAVYDALLAPVRKAAGKVAQLWLVPDGALNLIPFDALHDGGGYVLDSALRIRYLASGRDLVFSYGASSGRPPLVLGNPAIQAATTTPAPASPGPTDKKTAAAGPAKKSRGTDARSASVYDSLPSLSDLPDAEQEAREVARQLRVAALLGAQASEPALRGQISRGQVPRILHLAMHGVLPDDLAGTTVFGARARSVPVPFAPGVLPVPPAAQTATAPDVSPALDEPMLQSALVLAGAAKARQATEAKADGILTADEARELPLEGNELVVLSACQTALGSIRAGDGVYGLRRAFLAAGAEAVVASLWRVADQQTHSLMNKYYELLIMGRKPRISAMREAMTAIKQAHPHPYFWAPFIAIGRDEPIRPLDIRTPPKK